MVRKMLRGMLVGVAIAAGSTALFLGVNSEAKAQSTVILITSDQVEPWPLTVDEVRAVCFYMPKVVFRVGGIRGDYYALNNAPTTIDLSDMGVSLVQLTPDLDVWADNPNNPGAKIDISALRNKITEICE